LGDGAEALEEAHFSAKAKPVRYVQYKVSKSWRGRDLFTANEQDPATIKVGPNNNAPELVPVRSRSRKEAIHVNDLPSTMRETFRTLVVPHLREFAGILCPWQNP
jgi:hypothetical protein